MTSYQFEKASQATLFAKRLRKNFILTERVSPREVRIFSFELINETMRPIVLATAKRVYNDIIG